MKTKKKSKKKGFTLIELLIVIAIIAILSVVVVLTLNPAEMLKRSRDSNRLSDFSTMVTAINLYLSDVSSTNISLGTSTICYLQYGGAAPTSVYEFASSTIEATGTFAVGLATTSGQTACGNWFSTASTTAVIGTSSRSISGTGWLPINLTLISSGAPIGQWPTDPAWSAGAACSSAPCNGSAGHFYSYISTTTNNGYKLAVKMESALYSQGGTNDVESTDGGTDPNMYEQGTSLSL
jgi:prepilin-type N-terminal cleavage/methylation domain-containing protein